MIHYQMLFKMKRIILTTGILLVGFGLWAQTITTTEYFFDTDPGLGNATALSITPGASLSGTFTVDASALGSGFHTLTVRVQDDLGQWSVNHTGRFYTFNLPATSDQIVAAEYFFDEDPGLGEGTSLTVSAGSALSQTFTVSTENLTDGFHTLTFRVKNELGVWSTNHSGRFFVFTPNLPSDLVSLEYFFDEDPGIGLGQQLPLKAMGSVDSAFVVSIPDTLAEGTHTLFVRAKDANGIYSFAESRTFEVILDPIIDDFFPKEGGPGTQVSIVGSNFSAVSGENTVKFGEAFATNVVFASTDSLVVVVPSDASGIVPIEVNVGEKIGVSEELYNVDVAVAEGLIAYYPFNGNAHDESGNGNDGTVNGATLTIDRFGEVSSAYSFDGSDIITAQPVMLNSEFTFSAWVNVGNLASSDLGYTVVELTQSNTQSAIALDLASNEAPGIFFRNTGNEFFSNRASTPISQNSWTFVTGTYDGQLLNIYANSLLLSSVDVGPQSILETSSILGIGDDGSGGNPPFIGSIDNARIYNRALTPEEILELSADRPQEAPTIANQSFSITENRIAGTTVGTIVALDANNDPLSFEILSGNTGNTFSLVDSTGVLLVNDPETLDFEINPSFTLQVAVSDGIAASQAIITISVTDVDESGNQPPQLLAETYTVKENRINGLFIARLTAGDPDGDALTFSILSGNIGNAFLIDEDGNLITNNEDALDFEVNPQFDLLVRVSDGQVDVDETITILLQDVDESINQAPQANNASFSILENSANGTSVGTLLAGDPDGNDLTFGIISGNTGGTFAISSTGEISVANNALLDFETNPQFNLEVTISDGALTIARDVVVNLQDVVENEAPIVLDSIPSTTLTEGYGTYVVSLNGVFFDPDGDDLSYSVSNITENNILSLEIVDNDLIIKEIRFSGLLIFDIITVSANDGNGGIVENSFMLWFNDNPDIIDSLDNVNVDEGFGSITFNLSGVFSDSDKLYFSAISENANVVVTHIEDSILTINETGVGESLIIVTASDNQGGTANDEFAVSVEPDEALSVQELGIDIYPNPTKGHLTITNTAGLTVLSVTDISGKSIAFDIIEESGEAFTIDLSRTNEGIYFLNVKINQERQSIKIIKTN